MVYACGLCILSGKVLTCCRRARICHVSSPTHVCSKACWCHHHVKNFSQREEISSYLWDYYYCGHPNVRSLVAGAGWIRNLGDSRCVVVNWWSQQWPPNGSWMILGYLHPGDLWLSNWLCRWATKWLTAISGEGQRNEWKRHIVGLVPSRTPSFFQILIYLDLCWNLFGWCTAISRSVWGWLLFEYEFGTVPIDTWTLPVW